MLYIVLRCIQFFEHTTVWIWQILTRIGYYMVLLFAKVVLTFLDVLNGIVILGEEFRRFVFMLKQIVDEAILSFRLFGNSVCEFLFHSLICGSRAIDNLIPTKGRIEKASLGLIDLLLRSINLIADTAWWLVTLLPRTISSLLVAAGDFFVFGVETVRQCLCYVVMSLINDTMRTAVGLTVIIGIIVNWRIILEILMTIKRIAYTEAQYHLQNWRLRQRSQNNHRSIRSPVTRSPQRSLTPSSDTKLADHQRCVICQSRIKCVLLWPCRHLCLCDECADVMNQQNIYSCPLCRADVEETISVYV